MPSARRGLLAGAAALGALLAGAPLAPSRAEIPACGAATAGQLSRQVTVQCACRYFPASVLAGTPAGYRWDCGILQARLNQEVSVDLNAYPYRLPDLLLLEQSRRPLRP